MNTLKTVWIDGEDWEKVKNFGLSPSRVCRDAIRKAIENVQESKILEHFKNSHAEYFKNSLFCKLSHWRDLNPRPADYESAALPTELQWHSKDQVY